jgi:hypothetical protein
MFLNVGVRPGRAVSTEDLKFLDMGAIRWVGGVAVTAVSAAPEPVLV